jgi:hypothetical protein
MSVCVRAAFCRRDVRERGLSEMSGAIERVRVRSSRLVAALMGVVGELKRQYRQKASLMPARRAL